MLEGSSAATDRWVWFCGFCGHRHDGPGPPEPLSRACAHCGLGVLVEARAEIAPGPGDAFVIVDERLEVQAISQLAEDLLDVSDVSVVGVSLPEIMRPVDPSKSGELAAVIRDAADGHAGSRTRRVEPVVPTNRPDVEVPVTIARCGPPVAALLVFGPPADLITKNRN